MIIEGQYATTVMGGRNVKHYRALGYDVKMLDTITVPIEQLPNGSHELIDVECDYCHKTIKKVYKTLLIEREKSFTKKDCCSECIHIKNIETNIEKYGVENPMDRPEVVENLKKSVFEKYGVEYISQWPEMKKIKKDILTNKTEEVLSAQKEKTRLTMQERYGVNCGFQLPLARKRLFEIRSAASSQQIKLYEILKNIYGEENVCINFSLNTLSLDIVLSIGNIYIDIEYDSWYWHEPKRDRKRDEFTKSQGFSVLRIKSSKLIPDENILKSKINSMVDGRHSYSELILDDWNQEGYEVEGGRK